jgi:hypothetical protein
LPRYFTPEEANAALAELRPLAERMVSHRRALVRAQGEQAELVTQIATNGGDLDPGALRDLAGTLQRELEALGDCVRRIDELGVQVKDLDEGLLDFPARHGGEDVLLCWRLGEDEVAFWHGLEEGFAGRKPLPFD